MTFSVSVIAHVIVFYPFTSGREAPSPGAKTITFALLRPVDQAETAGTAAPFSGKNEKRETETLSQPVIKSPAAAEKTLSPVEQASQIPAPLKPPLQQVETASLITKTPDNLAKQEPAKKTIEKAASNPPAQVAAQVEAIATEPGDAFTADRREPVNMAVSQDKHQQVRQDYLQQLIARINTNKYYPKKARRRGWEGQVTLKFSVLPSGKVIDLEMLQSSSYTSLDQSALRAIYDSQPFAPIPANLGLTRLDLELPVVYQLK